MKIRNLFATGLLVMLVVNVSFAATKVLEWKFEGNTNDTSGNGIDGTEWPNAGSVLYTTGVSGQCFNGDGVNSVFKIGIDPNILPVKAADTWSVNVWVYPHGTPGDWMLAWALGNKPIANPACNSRSVYSSTAGVGNTTFTDGKGTSFLSTGIPWTPDTWQMITTTYDGTKVRLYKNGLLLGLKTWTFEDAPGEVRMASYAWGNTVSFNGDFDEFTVWRGALTQQEIIALIPPGILPEGSYLGEIAYYTLDDPNEDTITMPDHSGYSNTASIYGYTSPVGNWVTAGIKGGSLLFNGGQSIDLPTGVTVSQYAQHSVVFWFKSGYQPFNGAFYSEKSPISGNGSMLTIRGDAGTTGTIKAYSSNQYYQMQYSLTYDASAYMDSTTWHHLAVTCDGDWAKLYIDGNDVNTSPISSLGGKTSMNSSIGFNWDSLGFLGAWDKTYVDDFHMYKGALTQQQVQALAARGNINNDLVVNFIDLSRIEDEWRSDTTFVAGTTLLVDNMEGSLANWSVYSSGTYTGTGTISSTTNAYAGSKAMQWDYTLPARVGGNYSSIVYNLGTDRDLTGHDAMKLYLYRHAGNTSEDLMYLKFIDASGTVQAESWIQGPNSVVLPVNQWAPWYINLNAKLHLGTGYVDKTVLSSIRYIMIGCGGAKETARTGSIDIDEVKIIKYPICSPYLAGDIGSLEFKDCKVDFEDIAVFAEDWLIGVD